MSKRAEFIRKISILILYAHLNGIKLIPFSFYRTAEEQNELYQKGLSECDGYKKISKHQLWRAMDFYIEDEKHNAVWENIPEYAFLGNFWKSLGGVWGGDFKKNDIFHFEL